MITMGIIDMKFYDISFMEVSDLYMRVNSREGSTWLSLAGEPTRTSRAVVFHLSAGQEERFRRASDAFNAAMAEPITEQIASE